jgi:hypothetical protein
LEKFLRIGLFILVVGLVGSTVWLAMDDKSEGAWVTATLCIGLSIFTYLHRFKRFKGLGFEGELWEQEMEKAAELRLGLKRLTYNIAENFFLQMGPGARWGGIDSKTRFRLIEQTQQNMKSVGIDSQDIETIERPWHKCVMRDLADPITQRVQELTQMEIEKNRQKMGSILSCPLITEPQIS